MKKLLTLLAIVCLCFPPILNAQPPCGFDIVHNKLLATDPAFARIQEQNEEAIKRYIIAHPELRNRPTSREMAPLFTIPVVVHVMHTGGAIGTIYNPTDAQIIGAVNYLNAVYDGTHPSMTGGVGEIQIRFELAQRDPNCNPSNGIDRVDASGVANYTANGVNVNTSSGASELSIKNLSRWNVSNYYNIWIVNKLDGADGTSGQFIAGFAYFPGSSPLLDGTVMLATQMVDGEKTLPHEIGHALNLYHPFQGSPNAATCPANTTCSIDGDRICDTDPISYNQTGGIINFTCRSGANSCAGGNPYTAFTESNFMNYTNCYTLFTPDQKTRMLAAMSLPSRSGFASSPGATATYLAPICTPKINFELTGGSATESTVTTSGCRYYRDYTFNMQIGSDPSAAATATLAVSGGTATEGVDYDITTNGNFASPSKVVTFPSGSHVLQPFTVRIYDDEIIDATTETFTLNFTVNNGGGNAVLGEARTTFTITINDNDIAPIAPTPTGTLPVGTLLGTLNGLPMFNASLQTQKTQMSYTAAELSAAGIPAGYINSIAINLVKNSSRAFTGLTIKMGMHTVPLLVNSPTVNVISGLTTVMTLPSYTTVSNWNTFTLDVPFLWDGTSNIAIELCFDNGSTAANATDGVRVYQNGSGTTGNMIYQSNINCGGSFGSVTFSQYKPILQIGYGYTGNPIATTTISSLPQYLGANADVYFYSNTGQVLARVTNLNSFDYGCTQVSIDRTGSTSAQFWNNNAANYLASKSFRVIPTNNTTTGNYRVYLYYTQAEVNGWQTATGQSLASARVVKVSNGFYVPDVSASTPHLADVSSVSASNAAYGTDYAISGDFSSTGFSGFGVGIPGVGSVLPITLVSFNGHKEGRSVVLDWKTASEYNNDRFEIETSKDNRFFYKIGTIGSKGNSITEQLYSFIDNVPAKGMNYYRLRQVDIDGRNTNSNTIALTFDDKGNPVITYPNPTKDKLTIELAQPAQHLTLQIIGLDGRLIRQQVSGAVQRYETINTADLSNGTYILQVKTDTDIYNLKFVKQ